MTNNTGILEDLLSNPSDDYIQTLCDKALIIEETYYNSIEDADYKEAASYKEAYRERRKEIDRLQEYAVARSILLKFKDELRNSEKFANLNIDDDYNQIIDIVNGNSDELIEFFANKAIENEKCISNNCGIGLSRKKIREDTYNKLFIKVFKPTKCQERKEVIKIGHALQYNLKDIQELLLKLKNGYILNCKNTDDFIHIFAFNNSGYNSNLVVSEIKSRFNKEFGPNFNNNVTILSDGATFVNLFNNALTIKKEKITADKIKYSIENENEFGYTKYIENKSKKLKTYKDLKKFLKENYDKFIDASISSYVVYFKLCKIYLECQNLNEKNKTLSTIKKKITEGLALSNCGFFEIKEHAVDNSQFVDEKYVFYRNHNLYDGEPIIDDKILMYEMPRFSRNERLLKWRIMVLIFSVFNLIHKEEQTIKDFIDINNSVLDQANLSGFYIYHEDEYTLVTAMALALKDKSSNDSFKDKYNLIIGFKKTREYDWNATKIKREGIKTIYKGLFIDDGFLRALDQLIDQVSDKTKIEFLNDGLYVNNCKKIDITESTFGSINQKDNSREIYMIIAINRLKKEKIVRIKAIGRDSHPLKRPYFEKLKGSTSNAQKKRTTSR